MTALPVRHLAPNAAARAIRNAIVDLYRVDAPAIRGPADACDLDARGELLEQVALIFDRMIQTIVDDCAERCVHIDRSAFANVVAEAIAPLISHFDRAAEQWREDNCQLGVGA